MESATTTCRKENIRAPLFPSRLRTGVAVIAELIGRNMGMGTAVDAPALPITQNSIKIYRTVECDNVNGGISDSEFCA